MALAVACGARQETAPIGTDHDATDAGPEEPAEREPAPSASGPRRISAAPVYGVVREEVSFDAAHVTVRGRIVRPAAVGRFAAVLLVATGGPTDGDWCSPLVRGERCGGRTLAETLARYGLVVLRYDKRGSGGTPFRE